MDQQPQTKIQSQTPNKSSSKFTSYLTPIEKYRLEWNDLSTVCEDVRLVRLRQIACAGHMKVAKFRSICWAVLLDVLRGDQHDWLQQRRVHRAMYQHIKQKWHTNPSSSDSSSLPSRAEEATTTTTTKGINTPITDDPLSQSQESAWNQHFCDQELYGVIRQDVVRTFPGVDFYRRDAVQALMVNVLFCYAREQPAMCYRQGMHEILAPVLFVLHCDQQTMQHMHDVQQQHGGTATTLPSEADAEGIEEALEEILNPDFMEEDAYFMFMKIMSSIESFYHIHDMIPMASGHFPAMQSKRGAPNTDSPEVVGQLNFIRDRILANVDAELHKHLHTLDIPLTLFGIRWLRLLFGREFSLPDLLVLWEAIFAHGKSFTLTNYVVVAMLVLIRPALLAGDYTTCLTHLMKYPSNVDITLVIRYAMHIKSPQLYECPAVAFLPKPSRRLMPQQPTQSAARRRTVSHEEPTAANGKPTTASVERNAHNLRTIQKSTAKAAAQITAQAQAMQAGERDTSIVEGFRENSPEALRIELESAKAVMSITRFKLTQYLAVLRAHIPTSNAVDRVHQAMDGIEELCSLLEVKPSSDYGRALPVERAFEAANEPTGVEKLAETFEIVMQPSRNGNQQQQQQHASSNTVTTTPDSATEAAPSPSGSSSLDHEPPQQQQPPRRRLSPGAASASYEIPVDDRRISRRAFRQMGDRKEVELREFAGAAQRTVAAPLPEADPPGERRSPEYD